jgi:hypothetical protein
LLAIATHACSLAALGGEDVRWRALALRQARYSCRRRASTVWFGWSEPPMMKVRSGPNCASMGLAHDA